MYTELQNYTKPLQKKSGTDSLFLLSNSDVDLESMVVNFSLKSPTWHMYLSEKANMKIPQFCHQIVVIATKICLSGFLFLELAL